jgi:restriction system protein
MTTEELKRQIKVVQNGKYEPNITEQSVLPIISNLLSKLGFSVSFADTNIRQHNPDFIASKNIDNDKEYKIGIELKSANGNLKKGVETLMKSTGIHYFDKMLLLTLKEKLSPNEINSALNIQTINPAGIEIITLSNLENWINSLELPDSNHSTVETLVKIISQNFAYLIAKNPNCLNELEWRDIERTVAEVLEGIGFKVILTPSSKDGGKDIILECTSKGKNQTFIIELKHWRSGQKVGGNAIKEFVKVIINEKRDKGLYLATYGYTENYFECLKEIEHKKVLLGEKEKIISLCKTYVKYKSGIWLPTSSLEEILFENTISIN